MCIQVTLDNALEFYILSFYFWDGLIAFSGPQKLKFAGQNF